MEPHPSVKSAFASKYLIGIELGSGKTATVYLAEELKHARKLALKILRPDVSTAIDRKRFLREISLTARLSHPNILPLYDSGEIEGYIYYVMPFLGGETLSARLQRDGTAPLSEACSIVSQVAKALAHAHSEGCIHRDVKPANIIIKSGHAYLADFGVAAAISSSAADPLTTAGTAVGTPLYMSPEQLAGSTDLDHRTDQYSLACVAYEILEGHPPFFAGDAAASVVEKLSGNPPSFSTAPGPLPRQVQEAICRGLAVRRMDRYPAIMHFASSLVEGASVANEPHEVMGVDVASPRSVLAQPVSRSRRLVASLQSLARKALDRPTTSSGGESLPLPPTSFIGRTREVADVRRLLLDSSQAVVTIVGEPGVGKSRLAMEAARHMGRHFKDGIFFVPLAPVEAPAGVLQAVTRALGLPESEDTDALRRIATFARSRNILILLDNFEHLLDATPTVAAIAEFSPKTRTLVTSRQSLGLQLEHVYSLRGLEIEQGTDGEPSRGQGAISLFLARAKRVGQREPEPGDLDQIRHICQVLEGNPLAIEMASAWSHLIPAAELEAQIEKSLDFLTSRYTDAPIRHASMRAAIDLSLRRLSPSERQAFEDLGVFRGSFDRAAAEAIVGAGIETLASLVDKSLLSALPAGRFELHEMLRQIAAEQLDARTDAGRTVCEKHADHYSAVIRDIATSLMARRQRWASEVFRTEESNISKMWLWSCTHDYPRALAQSLEGIWIYYFTFSFEGHGERLLADAVAGLRRASLPSHPDLYQKCLIRLAFLLERLEKLGDARKLASEALQLASSSEDDREHGLCLEVTGLLRWPHWNEMAEGLLAAKRAYDAADDIWSQARVVRKLAWVAEASDREAAAEFHREALRLARSVGDRLGEATSLSGLAWDALYRKGKLREARRIRAEALSIREEYGEWASLRPLNGLMWDEIALGDFHAAETHAQRGLRIARSLGDQLWNLAFLLGLACIVYETNDFATAERLAQEVFSSTVALGDPQFAATATGILAQCAYAQGRDDEGALLVARARDLWDSADSLSKDYHPVAWWTLADEAVALAREGSISESERRLGQILNATIKNNGLHGSVMCVRRFAEVLAIEGRLEESVRLLSFVASYHGTWYESRSRAQRLLGQLKKQLPGKTYRRSQREGNQLSLDQVLAEVSARLPVGAFDSQRASGTRASAR